MIMAYAFGKQDPGLPPAENEIGVATAVDTCV
jgi:hypothetical protein